MARYRRRRKRRSVWLAVLAIAVVGVGGWWFWPEGGDHDTLQVTSQSPLTTDRPEQLAVAVPQPGVPERGENDATPDADNLPVTPRAEALLLAGRQGLQQQDLVTARTKLNEALQLGVEPQELTQLRADLVRLGDETVFSSRIFEQDPLVERYIVQPGDSLGKIATRNHISAGLLARINQIRNVNLIRAGQSLKVVKGPFHAVVDRRAFTLDVYLGDVFVKQYRVGLGVDGSTPSGKWEVAVKLVNPTYYPPRGGDILPADDPRNPLGERWIGLTGVGGEALGQARYGIHGTIEPDSIGQEASLGCIRMYNEDVEFLYDLLVCKHSTVTVK